MKLFFIPIFLTGVLVARAESQDPLPKVFDSPTAVENAAVAVQAQKIVQPFLIHAASSMEIDRFIQELKGDGDLTKHIERVSQSFLGVPYRRGPLGEGRGARYDSDPVIDLQKVDCTTFIEQTAALALAKNLSDAVDILQKIRYQGGKISFETRNHFPEADWIPNNIEAGYLSDITEKAGGARVRFASKRISKKEWYERKTISDLEGPHTQSIGEAEKSAIAQEWRRLGAKYADVTAFIPYLPTADLPLMAERIPSGAVISIVQDRADSPTLITHQGILVRKDGRAYLRHAAQNEKVLDVLMQDYFKARPGILGVNITVFKYPRLTR